MLCHALLAGRLNTFVTVLFLPRVFNAAQPNTLFSLIHYSLPRISRAAQYLVVTQNARSKKIGKRRGPAEQVARQTPQSNFDTTGLASPEVNTMGRRLNVASQSANWKLNTIAVVIALTFALTARIYREVAGA